MTRNKTGTRTSMFENFSDEDRDGDENVRGRQFSEIFGTSEDQNDDVLRRPGPDSFKQGGSRGL